MRGSVSITLNLPEASNPDSKRAALEGRDSKEGDYLLVWNALLVCVMRV